MALVFVFIIIYSSFSAIVGITRRYGVAIILHPAHTFVNRQHQELSVSDTRYSMNTLSSGENSLRTGNTGRIIRIFLIAVAAATALFIAFFAVALPMRKNEFLFSSDYSYMENIVMSENRDVFLGMAENYVAGHITEFENQDEVMKVLAVLLSPDRLSFARTPDYTGEAPSYTVYAGGKAFFTVFLSYAGKTLSGFDKWEVENIIISDLCEVGTSVCVEVPHGASVTVNGIELSDSRLSDSKTGYYALTEFEKDLADTVYCDRYELGVFFSAPNADAVFEGCRLTASEYKNGVIRFSYPPSLTTVYSLTVPYGSSVTVNGISLSNGYIIETGLKYPFLTRFEEKLPELSTSLIYQISGLFRIPEVSVSYNGVPLEDSVKGSYCLPADMTKTYKIYAPSDAVVKLNGVSAGKSEITAENIEFPILQDVTSYVKIRPYLTEYTVSGLLSSPEITASDAKGKALKADIYHSDENRILFLYPSTPEPPEKDVITLKTFAEYYVKYIYSGSYNLGNHYSNITAMTPAKSLAFTKLKNMYNSLYKADISRNIKFGNPEYYDYTAYSETAFSCMVKLPFPAVRNGETVSDEVTLQILYVYSGNIRRVINYLVYE